MCDWVKVDIEFIDLSLRWKQLRREVRGQVVLMTVTDVPLSKALSH